MKPKSKNKKISKKIEKSYRSKFSFCSTGKTALKKYIK
jgi:hypothetical protein